MNILNPYSCLISTKNFLYDQKFFDQVKANVPVISVGNITTGGTGKTPFIIYLSDLISKKYPAIKMLVISKSYKASLRSPAAVKLEHEHASQIYGDEPVLIQKLRPELQVWSGPNKSDTLKFVLELKSQNAINFDLVLIDDGFSHRKIKRDLDIVLVDVSQELSHYRLLPFGHLRESIQELKRSQLVVLTKINDAQTETLDFFKKFLKNENILYIEAEFDSDLEIDAPINDIVLFSGIGNPKQLELQLRRKGFQIVHHQIYSDHYQYKDADQNFIKKTSQKHSQATLCTTTKDFVKLSDPDLLAQIKLVNLKVTVADKDEGQIYEKISQIF